METKVQAPSECERTQNIVVTSDFVSALKRAMNWGKAEKLPDEYYGTAEPPVRCGESHLSGLTEPLHFVY